MAQRGNNEGSVYFDASKNRWRAAVVIDGTRRRASAPTQAGAKRKLRELMSEADQRGSLTDGNATVAQIVEQWTQNSLPARDLSPRTIEVYRWATSVINRELGSKRLRSLSPEDVEAALGRLTSGPSQLGRPSLIKIRSVLDKMLDYAQRRAIVNRNIARVVELPAEAERTPEGRALTVQQAKTLLAAAAEHRLHALWLTMLMLMLMLGLRPGEATGLTWADVDFDAGVIHFRRSLKLEHGQFVVDERLRTSKSRRSLGAPAELIAALRFHRKAQQAERTEAGTLWSNTDDLVLTTTLGSAINPSNLRRDFARLTERSGLGRWTPNELRHSAASIMSAAGLPIEQIADVLGHDGTRMTTLVYRNVITPSFDGAGPTSWGTRSDSRRTTLIFPDPGRFLMDGITTSQPQPSSPSAVSPREEIFIPNPTRRPRTSSMRCWATQAKAEKGGLTDREGGI